MKLIWCIPFSFILSLVAANIPLAKAEGEVEAEPAPEHANSEGYQPGPPRIVLEAPSLKYPVVKDSDKFQNLPLLCDPVLLRRLGYFGVLGNAPAIKMPKAIAQTSGDKEKVPGEPPGGENRVLGNPPAIKMAKANVLGVPPGGVNMVLGNPPAASGKSKITNEPNDAAEIAKINDEVPRGSLKGHQRAIKNFLKRLDKKPWTLVTLSKTDPMTEVTITAGNGIDQIVFHFEEHEEGKLRLQRTVPSLDNCKAK